MLTYAEGLTYADLCSRMLTHAGETVAAALRRMKAEKDFSADAFDKITSAAGSIYVYR